jgi:hypothetical protein
MAPATTARAAVNLLRNLQELDGCAVERSREAGTFYGLKVRSTFSRS